MRRAIFMVLVLAAALGGGLIGGVRAGDALANARTEPIIPGAQELKTSLQKQIEAAWFGQTPAQEALDNAAAEANRILAEKAQS